MNTMTAMAATFVQVSANLGQGVSSHHQKFKAHKLPTFMGVVDLMVADHWFQQVEKILDEMEITFDAIKIRLAVFQLEEEAHQWWTCAKTSRDIETMTWEEFQELFMNKYFPSVLRQVKA